MCNDINRLVEERMLLMDMKPTSNRNKRTSPTGSRQVAVGVEGMHIKWLLYLSSVPK